MELHGEDSNEPLSDYYREYRDGANRFQSRAPLLLIAKWPPNFAAVVGHR